MEARREVDLEAFVTAMAPVLGLPVTDEFRPGIVTNLRVTSALAALVLEFPLEDHIEQAAVFEA